MRRCICVVAVMVVACGGPEENRAKPLVQAQDTSPSESASAHPPVAGSATADPQELIVRVKTRLGVDTEVPVRRTEAVGSLGLYG